MNANEFIEFLEQDLAPVKSERTVLARFDPSFVDGPRNGSVFITFINLPYARFKEKRGGGAEAENNRQLFSVDGFSSDPTIPVAKVTVEPLVNHIMHGHDSAIRLRKKTGTPEKIAEYLATYIDKIANHFPPNFTHE